MTSPETSTPSPAGSTALTVFKIVAVIVAIAALVQGGLGIGYLTGADLSGVHSILGMATIVLAVIAAAAAGLWARNSWADRKGIAFHALAVAVLALIQVALGESGVRTIHITIGVLYLIAAVALGTLALRKGKSA